MLSSCVFVRNRAWRRHHNERVINNRLRIVKTIFNWWKPNPGKLRKWNFTCSCGMCKMDKYWGRKDKRYRENARSNKDWDY